ncbi:MAG: hypothetical protein GY737_31480 [Desulfobacteraceae bacterium]|nr:hypothetical protein [Desulfobacteraceae bacterium]
MLNLNGRLLDYLPAIYHTSKDLRELLAVLEAVLLGSDAQGSNKEGGEGAITEIIAVADRISRVSSLFDVYDTPAEFLPWLAQWVALIDLDGLDESRQRQLLAGIVPLYAKRGTKGYLERLLKLFVPENAAVEIDDEEILGVVVGNTKVGINSWLQHDRPFCFRVTIQMSGTDRHGAGAYRARREELVRRVIELAKPAHTLYELDWRSRGEERGD